MSSMEVPCQPTSVFILVAVVIVVINLIYNYSRWGRGPSFSEILSNILCLCLCSCLITGICAYSVPSAWIVAILVILSGLSMLFSTSTTVTQINDRIRYSN